VAWCLGERYEGIKPPRQIRWDHRGEPRRYNDPRGNLRNLGRQAPALRLRAPSGLCGDPGTPGRAAVPGMIEPRAADVLGLLLSGDGRRRAGAAGVCANPA
jgi:hypothetical protein